MRCSRSESGARPLSLADRVLHLVDHALFAGGHVHLAARLLRHPGLRAELPAVINGLTNLILDLWGFDAGAHARSAIRVAELPFEAPVEIEAIVEIAA
jgi:enamine deaminase RidA (YjgF/YER057c/UK114 family)